MLGRARSLYSELGRHSGILATRKKLKNAVAKRNYYSESTCQVDDFRNLINSSSVMAEHLNYTDTLEKNIPVYDAKSILPLLHLPSERRKVMAEWAQVLQDMSGVVVLKGAYPDHRVLDSANEVFAEIIKAEKEQNKNQSDHFAAAGNNDRIWNSLQKHCERNPESFALYYGNEVIAAVCEAWLGPSYQVTAQVNVVKPGGLAQEAHRDYHLGFQTAAVCGSFPPHVHAFSSMLTLQGAVAHSDMPVESGPTKLLPFSQKYGPGYTAWRLDSFRACFEEHYVQLPLSKGDALFFNPALFHAAGSNISNDISRIGNLLQVSSAFGKTMESVDRNKMCRLLYPALTGLLREGRMNTSEAHTAIAACAKGYSFPTNLDSDAPVDGLAPETQAALFVRALQESWSDARFFDALLSQEKKQAA